MSGHQLQPTRDLIMSHQTGVGAWAPGEKPTGPGVLWQLRYQPPCSENRRRGRLVRLARLSAMGAAAFALAGCSLRVPDCHSPEVAKTIKYALLQGALQPNQAAAGNVGFTGPIKPEEETPFTKNFSVTLSEVAVHDFDRFSRTRVCSAEIEMRGPADQWLRRRAGYTVQRLSQDDKTRVELVGPGVGTLAFVMRNFVLIQEQIDANAVNAAPPPPPPSPAPTAEAAAATGPAVEYESPTGVLTVTPAGDVLRFQINASRDTHACELEGQARLAGSVAQYGPKSASDACEATMRFEADGSVRVVTKSCEGQCGLNAAGAMDGLYKKKPK